MTTYELSQHITIQQKEAPLIRDKLLFFCFLLIEEFRRTQNKIKFQKWVSTFKDIAKDCTCSAPYAERVDLTLQFMRIRFEGLNDHKTLQFYEKLIHRNNHSERIKRKFLNY